MGTELGQNGSGAEAAVDRMLPPPQMMIAVALPAFSHAERERWSTKRGPSRLEVHTLAVAHVPV